MTLSAVGSQSPARVKQKFVPHEVYIFIFLEGKIYIFILLEWREKISIIQREVNYVIDPVIGAMENRKTGAGKEGASTPGRGRLWSCKTGCLGSALTAV